MSEKVKLTKLVKRHLGSEVEEFTHEIDVNLLGLVVKTYREDIEKKIKEEHPEVKEFLSDNLNELRNLELFLIAFKGSNQ